MHILDLAGDARELFLRISAKEPHNLGKRDASLQKKVAVTRSRHLCTKNAFFARLYDRVWRLMVAQCQKVKRVGDLIVGEHSDLFHYATCS
jgi:hypothetical protein